mmetsp:Transcript_21114/g.35260  ORF Transcript_21114/g.35260 Transcript_21114/m.35260 type:complete len:375 (-) Transcript_21114:224-1348(-)
MLFTPTFPLQVCLPLSSPSNQTRQCSSPSNRTLSSNRAPLAHRRTRTLKFIVSAKRPSVSFRFNTVCEINEGYSPRKKWRLTEIWEQEQEEAAKRPKSSSIFTEDELTELRKYGEFDETSPLQDQHMLEQDRDVPLIEDVMLMDPHIIGFFSSRACPYAHRVWLALEKKRIEYNRVEIDLVDKPVWVYQIHAPGTVPFIKFLGRVTGESMEICRQLEKLKPDPSLFPVDTVLSKRLQTIEQRIESRLASYLWVLLARGTEGSIEDMKQELRWWNANAGEWIDKGKYLDGVSDTCNMLDLAVYPFLLRVQMEFEQTQGLVGWFDTVCPKLSKWIDNLQINEACVQKAPCSAKDVENLRKHLYRYYGDSSHRSLLH